MMEMDCSSGDSICRATLRRHSAARGQSVLIHRRKVLGMGRSEVVFFIAEVFYIANLQKKTVMA